MNHAERLYLMTLAEQWRTLFEEAESRGEEFHLFDTFVPLKAGYFAQARVQKVNLTDEKPSLILRLRFTKEKPKDELEQLASVAAVAFFESPPARIPGVFENGKHVEVVYCGPVPSSFGIPSSAPAIGESPPNRPRYRERRPKSE